MVIRAADQMNGDKADINDATLILPLDLGGDGLRVAVKDCIDIVGTTTSCGSACLKDAPVAQQNAEIVDHLLAHNCKIIGKANMHEFAYGVTGINRTFGTPINPKWPDKITGGSSSGSASAVAQGLCDFAIGTDTGGSVRQPAICCGIFGIKPTFGRVSRHGCSPAQTSLDCIGVFTRSASELAQAMSCIDPTFQNVRTFQPKIGLVRASDMVEEQLIEDMMTNISQDPRLSVTELSLPLFAEAFDAGLTIIGREASIAYGSFVQNGGPLGADVLARLKNVMQITDSQVAEAEQVRTDFSAQIDLALEQFDVLMSPALPTIPPNLDEADDPRKLLPLTRLLRPFNLSGHPALVLPIPVGDAQQPAGIQLIGRKGEDEKLCAAATWLENNWLPDRL